VLSGTRTGASYTEDPSSSRTALKSESGCRNTTREQGDDMTRTAAWAMVVAMASCVRFGYSVPDDARGGGDGAPHEDAFSGPDGQAPADVATVGHSDLGPQDGPVSTGPCSALALAVPWNANMAICQVPDSTRPNQCDANSLAGKDNPHCGPEWHLCTASEYLTNGGDQVPPSDIGSGMYWLAGCIREGAGLFAPTNAVCTTCHVRGSGSLEVAWECAATQSFGLSEAPLGLAAASGCNRVGIDDPATEGFWWPVPSGQTLPGVMCCR
jgi:hypothetical protein